MSLRSKLGWLWNWIKRRRQVNKLEHFRNWLQHEESQSNLLDLAVVHAFSAIAYSLGMGSEGYIPFIWFVLALTFLNYLGYWQRKKVEVLTSQVN